MKDDRIGNIYILKMTIKKKKEVYKKGFRAELVFLLCTVHWVYFLILVYSNSFYKKESQK